MKICFVHRRPFGFLPDLLEYAEELANLGHQITFVGPSGNEAESTLVKVVNLNFESTNSFLISVKSFLRSKNFDIIHVFHFRGVWKLAYKRAVRAKYVIDVRTLHVSDAKGRVSKISFLKDRLTWIESLFFDDVLALTSKIKKRMSPHWKPVKMVPLGATRISFSKEDVLKHRKDIRLMYGINDDEVLIVYSGTLAKSRNCEIYLKVLSLLDQKIFKIFRPQKRLHRNQE